MSHYRVGDRVGAGGMGVVHAAVDQRLGRRVALKFLPPEWSRDEEARERFYREASTAASLDHKNICTVYDVDETVDNHIFIATAFYEGVSLRERLKSGVSLPQALDWCAQVAEGLSVAHANNVLHRDIKPSNLILTPDGVVKIIDFGLALFTDQSRLSDPGTAAGTVAYMSPEAVREEDLDDRADVWSLGVVLYEMLAGTRPFRGGRPEAVVHSILKSHPKRLRHWDPRVQRELNAIIDGALAKSPEHRLKDCREFGTALRALEASLSPEDATTRRGSTWRRGAAIAAVAGLAVLGANIDRSSSTRDDPDAVANVSIPATRPLAVTYFRNLTEDESLDWLGSGLAEMIVTKLSEFDDLNVISSDRVYRALGSVTPVTLADQDSLMTAAAELLGSEVVLDGSFARAGTAFRLTARVRDVVRGEQLATASADAASLAEVFDAVDRLTERLRDGLGLGQASEGLAAELAAVTTSSPEAFQRYATALRMRYDGRAEEATAEFERAIALDGSFALALSKLSVLYALDGRDRDAAELSARAMDHRDRLPLRERYYVEGNHYSWHEETYGQAIDAYRRAAEEFPNHWAALHNLASTYADLELYTQALPLLQDVARGVPERISNYWLMAICHFGAGDADAGLDVLEAAERSRPLAPTAKLQLADYLAMIGEFDRARAAFASGGMGGDDFEALDRRWTLHLLEGDTAALGAWLRAGDRPGGAVPSRLLLREGVLALYEGDLELGIETLRRAANAVSEPGRTSAFPRRLAAQALLESGMLSEALVEAEHAISEGRGDQGEWAGLFVKGVGLARSGDLAGAEATADTLRNRTALIPGPKEERRYLHLLGEIALARGDLATARSRLTSAERLLPHRGVVWDRPAPAEHVPLWDSLARLYLALGDDATARAYFQRIVSSSAERLYWPLEYRRGQRYLATRGTP